MDTSQFLLMLQRYRLLYVVIFIVAFFAGVYLLIPWTLKYEGESTFYLANESMVNPALFTQSAQQDLLQVNLVQERIYQLAYSTEMMEFLIGRYNLYDHYNIDSTKTYHFERIVRVLTKNVRFKKLTGDLSGIVVIDRNNEMAATLANGIVWKLNEMNRKYLIDKIQGNLIFYESFLQESIKITREQNRILQNSIDNLSNFRNHSGDSRQPLSEIEFSLFQAATRIEDITTQLALARNLYSNALTSQQAKNLPSLVIVKRALPDLKSKKPMLFIFAALTGMLAVFGTIVLMFLYLTYQKELKIVFGKKS